MIERILLPSARVAVAITFAASNVGVTILLAGFLISGGPGARATVTILAFWLVSAGFLLVIDGLDRVVAALSASRWGPKVNEPKAQSLPPFLDDLQPASPSRAMKGPS